MAEAEGIKLPGDIRQLIVREAGGSPRQALTNLDACRGITDRREAAELLTAAMEEGDAVLALCRTLTTGQHSWTDAMKLVEKLKGQSAEGVQIVVMNYLAAALRNSKSDKDACYLLNKMQAFRTAYGQSDGDAQLLMSIGECLFNQ